MRPGSWTIRSGCILEEEKGDYALLFFPSSVRWSKWSQSSVLYQSYIGVKVMIIKQPAVADIWADTRCLWMRWLVCVFEVSFRHINAAGADVSRCTVSDLHLRSPATFTGLLQMHNMSAILQCVFFVMCLNFALFSDKSFFWVILKEYLKLVCGCASSMGRARLFISKEFFLTF